MKIGIGEILTLQKTIDILEKIKNLNFLTGSAQQLSMDSIKDSLDIEESVDYLNNMLRNAMWEVVYEAGIEKKIEEYFGVKLKQLCETYPEKYEELIKVFGKLIPSISNILNGKLTAEQVALEPPPLERKR
jgi:hypothetical protein